MSPHLKEKSIPLGPEPTLLSRKEVDALYETLDAVRSALHSLNVDYIVTGGSLLGAIRQHSILFCDDDIDIAIIDVNQSYQRVLQQLQVKLGPDYKYNPNAWEGGGQVRPKRMSNIFLDLFVLRDYQTLEEFTNVVGMKKNGMPQPQEYIQSIMDTIQSSIHDASEEKDLQNTEDPIFPLWHFATRKAIEMWPKEVYRPHELFPLERDLKFGPLTNVQGPRMPVLLLKRAFGLDCFHVYYNSQSHKQKGRNTHHVDMGRFIQDAKDGHNPTTSSSTTTTITTSNGNHNNNNTSSSSSCTTTSTSTTTTATSSTTTTTTPSLTPVIANGGTWDSSEKTNLEEEHYIPIQPLLKSKRRQTFHCRESLFEYLTNQSQKEESWTMNEKRDREFHRNRPWKVSLLENGRRSMFVRSVPNTIRPRRTVYMDGVFDMFHIGHLSAIQEAAALGDRVIIGITGQQDATEYKREPIIPQEERIQIVASLSLVDAVVCPCPLIVTKEFMDEHGIDLVVHGFANDDDLEKQREFFEIPMRMNKFRRIPYYKGTSTTDIIRKIQSMK